MLGQAGEKLAGDFLVQRGYKILDSNVRLGTRELDLVVFDQKYDELVFVEVKTRDRESGVSPSRAVNWQKKLALTRAAQTYLELKGYDKDYRFDIISVVAGQITHLENITW